MVPPCRPVPWLAVQPLPADAHPAVTARPAHSLSSTQREAAPSWGPRQAHIQGQGGGVGGSRGFRAGPVPSLAHSAIFARSWLTQGGRNHQVSGVKWIFSDSRAAAKIAQRSCILGSVPLMLILIDSVLFLLLAY